MKKCIAFFWCLALIFIVAGCGNNSSSGRTRNQPAGVSDVLEAGMSEEDGKNDSGRLNGVNEGAPKPKPVNESEISASSAEGIDVDLTSLSSTMVYAEVYSMMASPEDYIGKTVKMDGLFNYYHDETTNNQYFSCIIQDATACCAQGIEFILADDCSYPDDYPEIGGEICVTGVFDTYQEGGYTYCTLRNAKLL